MHIFTGYSGKICYKHKREGKAKRDKSNQDEDKTDL